jgi:hypothetical protein
MPNDAKLGLLVGVGLVVAVAVMFFQNEAPAPSGDKSTTKSPAAVVPAESLSPAMLPSPPSRPDRSPQAQTASRNAP